jgi:hypothetical protein
MHLLMSLTFFLVFVIVNVGDSAVVGCLRLLLSLVMLTGGFGPVAWIYGL